MSYQILYTDLFCTRVQGSRFAFARRLLQDAATQRPQSKHAPRRQNTGSLDYTTMMLSRSSITVARAAARPVARRNMSTASPKMHKASGNWETIQSKRKLDHDDMHVSFSTSATTNTEFRVSSCLLQTVFHPPFNAGPVWGIVGGVWLIGVGSMLYGYVHQQRKQGFWK